MLQIKIYPELERNFLTILRNSGLPDLKFGKKIDFENYIMIIKLIKIIFF